MDQPLSFGFIPIEGGAYYPEFLEEVLLGEQLGFDSVWLEEHHGIRDHYRDEYGGGKWKHPLIGSADAAPVDQFDALGRDRFIVGSPETVIR